MSKLTKIERRWATATLSTIFPGGGGVPSIDEMSVGAFMNDVCAHTPFKAFLGLRFAILLIALAPLFILGKLKTIAGASIRDREKVLERLLASRVYAVRQLVMMMKAMGALLYAAHPAVRARMMKPIARRESGPRLAQLRIKRHAAA